MARSYRLKQRAVRQNETRHKIVTAAVDLFCANGPARTSILAIAERAGVERPTVYRHFPTPEMLHAACSTRFWTDNPMPDPEPWCAIADPEARLRHGLSAVYAFYARVEPALWNILRDLEDHPEWHRLCAAAGQWQRVSRVLAAPFEHDGTLCRCIEASLGLALDFFSWRGLWRRGARNEEIVELMTRMILGCTGDCAEEGAAGGRGTGDRGTGDRGVDDLGTGDLGTGDLGTGGEGHGSGLRGRPLTWRGPPPGCGDRPPTPPSTRRDADE
ncbi:transcriptional regulator, TetR family [Rhodovulum sp. PH10]|uniref:TetR/AcrR family transcriptional regulator n=1 Tax=Rhodovulum sp. PH10 TaxID=1187851 RepID=UPI00027C29EF|nr:TetR/AcrR family transcriptional regulator [Rhodovulum sp. PH10]EJW12628.1 transcriptional regulator, TetR family [Rhodovulum sp. PH10]